ncbi:lipoyl synthase [Myxococcota bacterium]|nr:lipoyl synthase [Myxococcota bacterium]MBU1432240.1 lipoyl synthase [Myxococcota bacterium]
MSELVQIQAPRAGRKPEWLRVKPAKAAFFEVKRLTQAQRTHTVCQEAACPNVGACWSRGHAAFLILGDVCTRDCAFCDVRHGAPGPVDEDEPRRLAEVVEAMGLRYVVITSVTRDDLPDGGAGQFAACLHALRARRPALRVEVLTPDFQRKPGALERVLDAAPDVFNHNLETVPRLYPSVRAGARYDHSLDLLARAKRLRPEGWTKSGLMLGLGEQEDEVLGVMDDLRAAGVDLLTLGQYLQPSRRHAPVARYLHPDEFTRLGEAARARGFSVQSSPLTRSSHLADEDFERISRSGR